MVRRTTVSSSSYLAIKTFGYNVLALAFILVVLLVLGGSLSSLAERDGLILVGLFLGAFFTRLSIFGCLRVLSHYS